MPVKDEIVQEVKFENLATKSDLQSLEVIIEKTKNKALLYVLTGVWAPIIIAIIIGCVAKHFSI